MSGLLDVFVLLSFLFVIYAIIGIQLWNGQLRSQCFELSDLSTPTGEPCTSAGFPHGYHCTDTQVCMKSSHIPNPNENLISFDNIGTALLTIFSAITMADWSQTMYFYMDAWAGYAWIYWCSLILLVSFFAV